MLVDVEPDDAVWGVADGTRVKEIASTTSRSTSAPYVAVTRLRR